MPALPLIGHVMLGKLLKGFVPQFTHLFNSVHSVVSDSLQPHELQPARPHCPSPTPGVYSNTCPLSWWCHPTISSSVAPFSSCLQSFPASGSFPMSLLFASSGQSTGVSVSPSVLPMNIQGWFPLGLTGLITLQSKGKYQFSVLSLLYGLTLTSVHNYWKNHSFDYTDLYQSWDC